MCDLGKPTGNIQSGVRPVLIISNNVNNKHCPNINVFPITSRINKKLPVHVLIDRFSESGLTKPSMVMVEQPMTIALNQLIKPIGKVSDICVLENIKNAMLIQFPIFATNAI